LETPHLILQETLSTRFKSDKNETVDVRVADFDNTQYHVAVTSEDRDTMTVSTQLRDCSKVLASCKEYIQELYPGLLQDSPLPTFDLTMKIDLKSLPEDTDALATKLACLKPNLMAAPFVTAGRALVKGAPLDKSSFYEFRQGEFLYVIPMDDRVVVTYDMAFKDPTDFAIAKVFLQEFNEVGRIRELASAPNPTYSPKSPLEISEDPSLSKTLKDNCNRIGYVSFAFHKRHLEEAAITNSAYHIIQFRSYIHYHIKCSKSYMHTRMRNRVDLLLKVLNRAIPDVPKDKKSSKTASGRSFKHSGGASAGL